MQIYRRRHGRSLPPYRLRHTKKFFLKPVIELEKIKFVNLIYYVNCKSYVYVLRLMLTIIFLPCV
ncbi:MAG: hypothetical protein LBK06_04610 [Planctomycetaceae bacterium]|nr:hypothetical protein [Planctomycetaceae bacterium]